MGANARFSFTDSNISPLAAPLHRAAAREKIHTCIRTIEEVDKEAHANYDDEMLLDVGCERTMPKDNVW